MLLPDTVVGWYCRTRFPIGISFPAGSGGGVCCRDWRNAAGYAGIRLVRLKAKCSRASPRDLVHAIPLYAIEQGLLTVRRKARKTSSLAASSKLKVCRI
ncbi:hypothetical protein ACNKHP_18505 [Shigella boydii]